MNSTAILDPARGGPSSPEGALAIVRQRLCRDELAAPQIAEPEVADPAAAAALTYAEAALDDLFAAGVSPGDHFDAVAWIKDVERLGRRVDAARAALTATIQRRALHAPDGHGSAKIMIRHVARLSESEATARAKTARAYIRLPEVAAAWRAGNLPTCAVRVLGRIATNRRVAAAMVGRQDEFIADAKTVSAKTFARKAYRWARLIDEDGPEPANERNHKNRDARLPQNPWDLSWDLTGFFASTQGAEMREIFDRYIDAEFQADWAAAKAADLAAGGTGDVTNADLDRTDAQRRADALHRVFQDAAASPEGAVPPGFVHTIVWSEAAYHSMLTAMEADRPPSFDPDTFVCRTGDGYDVDPCEASANSLTSKFRRLVVDAAGVTIDLGRARRFTGLARLAATVGQVHCIWPGCHAPSSRCDIDHLHEHGSGGSTNPSNAAPLCGKHNRWKQKGFTIRRLQDGSWKTTRPDGSKLE